MLEGELRDRDVLRHRLRSALQGRPRREQPPDAAVAAAVLVLLVFRYGEARLVFTKRSEAVPHHKGQFAFPGGVVAQGDASRIDTALREAREEIDLDPGSVEVLGVLDDATTGGTRFVITPVVGLCGGAPVLRADGRETERVVEIPLRHLLDPAAFREEVWMRDGQPHPVAFFTRGEDVVWGATGRILKEFLEVVFPEWQSGGGGG